MKAIPSPLPPTPMIVLLTFSFPKFACDNEFFSFYYIVILFFLYTFLPYLAQCCGSTLVFFLFFADLDPGKNLSAAPCPDLDHELGHQ